MTTPKAHPALEKLIGKWQRPDGGYVLELKSISSEGILEAGYFNPGPIRVANARAFHAEDRANVFVELRDVGYPGCTYRLKHDPATDQLYGEYYQAAMQETFDVTFARLKE